MALSLVGSRPGCFSTDHHGPVAHVHINGALRSSLIADSMLRRAAGQRQLLRLSMCGLADNHRTLEHLFGALKHEPDAHSSRLQYTAADFPKAN